MDPSINPINVPSTIVFPKSDANPEEVMKQLYKRLGRGNRCSVKLTKIFGKYFFENLNDNEYKQWIKTNTGVKYDVVDDKGIIDWGLKIKALDGKNPNGCSVGLYYFPSINNGTESAIMAIGHHTHHDGLSQM